MPRGGVFSPNVGLFMLFNLVLIVCDKKTQAMILGNPFQEINLFYTLGTLPFFGQKWPFLRSFHDSRHNLHKSQALQKK